MTKDEKLDRIVELGFEVVSLLGRVSPTPEILAELKARAVKHAAERGFESVDLRDWIKTGMNLVMTGGLF